MRVDTQTETAYMNGNVMYRIRCECGKNTWAYLYDLYQDRDGSTYITDYVWTAKCRECKEPLFSPEEQDVYTVLGFDP